ncbi:hypothetical protein K435DRAFT_875444 [Dendrothele bispora CBS 962.96]|uniref:Uncharacterized protein n=1 Tax=Dendrothele bispora (strain CBS 962.96) TaxID=1314807 RepID=A0A4V4HBI5_DENBC|nr:hypothetical protein K435DRAFT_875444 [Dendrothele bispora CBS 962.96]
MPRLKPSTRRRNLGPAADLFPGDRVAVVRSINVLIAELVMQFGCSVPTSEDAADIDDHRRILLNVDVGDFFGCWYAEVPRSLEGDNHPITTMEWLTQPDKWQECAMKDPKVQTLIAMRRRAEWRGEGPKVDGLPSDVVRKYRDRLADLRGEVLPTRWEYLDSACRPFVKGTKTPRERELFYEPHALPPRPWDSEALLALGAARRRRYRRSSRSTPRSPRSSSPRVSSSTRRGLHRRSASRSASVESARQSRSSSVVSSRSVRSISPVVVRRGRHSQTVNHSRRTSSRWSSQRSVFPRPVSRRRNIRSRSRSPQPVSSSHRELRRRSLSRSLSVEPLHSNTRSYTVGTRRSSGTKGKQSVRVHPTHRSQKSNKDRAVVNPYQASPSTSGSSRRSSRGSHLSSPASSVSRVSRTISSQPSSPALSIRTLRELDDSDSDLPSMEELRKEFDPSYTVIALLWLKNGDYAEELLMNVTKHSTNLAQQKLRLGRIGVEPDVTFELFENGVWRRVLRAEIFDAPREKKVYLRAEGVTQGHKMPCPSDVIEID